MKIRSACFVARAFPILLTSFLPFEASAQDACHNILTTWLVAEREIRMMRLRSKSFLISTAVLLLIVLASVIVGGFMGANPTLPKVAAVGTAIAVS